MSDRHKPPVSGSDVSADLDAYRRHRGSSPRGRQVAFLSQLDDLKPSTQPQLVFARLADAVSESFADGCQVELSDGVEPPLSMVSARDGRRHDAPHDPANVVEAPFHIPSRGGQPSYAGILTLWWEERPAAESDRIVAELLVRYAAGLVDRQRLMDRVGASEARAASAAMEAIASRQVNLAVGILMARGATSAADAEASLADLADDRGAEIYTVAAETVRRAARRGTDTAADPDSERDGASNVRVLGRGE